MTETTSLIALLRVDQEARWQLGDPVRVENYLLLHPGLISDPEGVLELIWNEMRLCQQRGEPPQLIEYLRRFGQFEDRLPALFHLLQDANVAPPTVAAFAVEDAKNTSLSDSIQTVPGYEIVAELGRGGMGVVYRAKQAFLKRQVALKMILSGLHADPIARARFRTEAEAVARLQHPNIVQIFEVGEHQGRPFLCLEFLEGGNLRQHIANAPPTDRAAAHLVETLAGAVQHTHQRGILHRDLNPNNVLLTGDGTPKISDFGLAKLLDADAGMTRTEAFLGTPNYMAPEQAAGHMKQVGPGADIYSLGAILYEMLTALPPFAGQTVLATLEMVRNQEPVPPRRLRKSVARDLETICLKCLEKAPGHRYPSAAALASDLRLFLNGQPIQAKPLPLWRKIGRVARRHPRLVAGFGMAVLFLCLILTGQSYFQAREQLAARHREDKYQQFVRRRNDAHFYGLLSGDQGVQFLGNTAEDNLKAAEAAARDALALAGVAVDSDSPAGLDLPAAHSTEVREDCYALLLVLAGVREQQAMGQVVEKERCQEALQILDRAGTLGFQTRAIHLRRAYFLEKLGRQDEARSERTRANALPLVGALDYFLLGEEQFRHGDWDLAIASFDRTRTLQPGHFWSQFFLAVCHLQTRQWEAARAELSACLQLRPDFVWAYLFRSFANETAQAWPEAEADFQRALELDPKEDARYVLFLTRGILHFNRGTLDQAASDFRAAQLLRPGQYNAYLSLAQVCLAQNQFNKAEELLQQALQLKPPVPVVYAFHLERGRQLLRSQRYEEAFAAGLAAGELAPERPQPDELRGHALLALGRYDAAEESFCQYVRKDGEARPDIYRCRGLARMKLGRYPEAAEDYSRALELSPDGSLYQHRGWAFFFADAWKLAARDFSTAIKLNPEVSDSYTGRGLARVMLGNYREAVADADEAIRLQPNSPEMMHNLACLFAQAAVRAFGDDTQTDGQALAKVYRGRALDAVEQTLKLVSPQERRAFWRNHTLPDAALVPLHQEPRFRRLREEIERSQVEKPSSS